MKGVSRAIAGACRQIDVEVFKLSCTAIPHPLAPLAPRCVCFETICISPGLHQGGRQSVQAMHVTPAPNNLKIN